MGRIKLGPSEGNSGALVRWGRHLDNGLWLTSWRFRFIRHDNGARYLRFAWFQFSWGEE